MRFDMQSILWKSGLLLIAGTIALACAEERDAIDRVQPYALKKEFFIGADYNDTRDDPEFWGRTTVTDVGYGAMQELLFPSTVGQGVARLKWQMTEDYLIARATFERIDASDGLGAPKKDNRGNAIGTETNDGQVVASFRIQSHFDIVNAYNSTTGEKLNVVEENAYDRPWYERDYVRVDWSKNVATDTYDFDVLAFLGIFGTTYEPMSYYVEDPNDPDAPVFDLINGYFDVTTKAFARPGMVDLGYLGWGIDKYPACFLPGEIAGGTAPMGNCNPVEITLRHSFRRIVDTDYEPAEWDGAKFTTFGAFYSERYGYSRNYGMTDTAHHRIINRYNIWERSHYYDDPENMTGEVACYTPETTGFGEDPNRGIENNGTADECKSVGKGSRCDTFKQKCTLPYSQRVEKPIAWYYSNGSDLRYFDPVYDAAHDWDVALRMAVQSARYAECKATGGKTCDKDYPVYHGQIDDGQDLIFLAREVDACRQGKAYLDKDGFTNPANCDAVADSVGKARGYDPGVIALAKKQEMVVLCHSPVQFYDPPACGDRRLPLMTVDGQQVEATGEDCTWAKNLAEDDVTKEIAALIESCDNSIQARLGDLRYHTINVFYQPQTPSPWGIMVSAVDPVSGETFATSANAWSFVNDFWAQSVVDQARLIKGDLTPEELTGAKNVQDYAKMAQAAQRGGAAGYMSKEFVSSRISEFATGKVDPQFLSPKTAQSADVQALPAHAINELRNLKYEMQAIQADASKFDNNAPIYAARAKALQGTEIEAELMSEPIRQLTGTVNLPLSDSMLNIASPLRGAAPHIRVEFKRMLQNVLHKRGMCMLEADMAQTPLAIAALSDILEEKFGPIKDASQETFEKMRLFVARRAMYNVMAHEMGHSVAHRHNFVSSSDAWNYRPQYWQLRTQDGDVSTLCEEYTEDGETCVGPRYFDPVTDAEDKGLIWMWMQSSLMDYAGETTQDFLGIGAYDFAATRMFYGETVAVMASEDFQGANSTVVLDKLNSGFGGLGGYSYDPLHYSELNAAYKLIDNCKAVDLKAHKPAIWNEARDGKWHPTLDGYFVSPKGNDSYTSCDQQKVDYVTWSSLKALKNAGWTGLPSEYWRNNLTPESTWAITGMKWGCMDDLDRPLAPYGFATDRWADIGNVAVYRHDNGADTFEIFNFLMTQREMNHMWDAYRRDRAAFSVAGYMGRILGRYNAKIRDGAKGMGLYRGLVKDFGLRLGINPDTAWRYIINAQGLSLREPIISAGMVFDTFARELARPQSGEHGMHPWDMDGVNAGDYDDVKAKLATEPEAVLYSSDDLGFASPPKPSVIIPDGPFAANGKYFSVFSPGGALLENKLQDGTGDLDAEFTMTAGSYYPKLSVGYLMSESADNFISSSRGDFTDPRYRAVSLASVFPEGYRRLLGNMLTDDEFIKGPRVAADANGHLMLNEVEVKREIEPYLDAPIGWTTWWGETPRTCFPANGTNICEGYLWFDDETGQFENTTYPQTRVLDPQVKWEQQKWLILDTLVYLADNEKLEWFDSMKLFNLTVAPADGIPANRIEFHDPEGDSYAARTSGREVIFGKTVQKGIAARVLEYANSLLAQAYVTTPVDRDGDGVTDWYLPVMGPSGEVRVKYDPYLLRDYAGLYAPESWGTCDEIDNSGCRCEDNRACMKLREYRSIPSLLQRSWDFVFNEGIKGIY